MSKISIEMGTDDIGQLVDFVGSSVWLILDRHSGMLWKLLFLCVGLVFLRYYVLHRKTKPKSSTKKWTPAKNHEDSDSDEEPEPRHLASRGRSPHRGHRE